jgi:four helix bundle protein
VDRAELEERTKRFALRIIRFVTALPRNRVTGVLRHQLLKAGASIGANYRESNRAESRNDLIHKIAIVEKEAAETQYWLELLEPANMGHTAERRWLLQESGELLAIFTSSGKSAKAREEMRFESGPDESQMASSEIRNPHFALRNRDQRGW